MPASSVEIQAREATLPNARVADSTTGLLDLEVVIDEIAARRDEFDERSHVPRDVIDKLKLAGVFRASTPRRFGGSALAPAAFFRIIERIAMADGSAAWVAAFGSANIYLAALPVETQKMLYANGPDQIFAGALYPVQAAERIEGGWRVDGQWKFASGCMCADWLGVGIGGAGPAGQAAQPLTAVFPPSQVEIVENWDVVGLQGTGSHDLRVSGRVIDDAWTFVRGAASTIDEPVYRYPSVSYQAGVHAAVNLGLARAALEVVTGMSGSQVTTTGAPRLADRPHFRIELAKCEAALRSTRAFFYETAEEVWDSIHAGRPVSVEQANLLRLSAIHAAHTTSDVIQRCYKLGGIAAIYRTHRLQRIVRDSMVVTQHALLGESGYDGAGALFAGVPAFKGYP